MIFSSEKYLQMMLENTSNIPILTILILLPLVGAVVLYFIPGKNRTAIRTTAMVTAGLDFLISLGLLFRFDPSTHKMQFIESSQWIPELGVGYFLGVDGMSLLLLLLTTFTTIISILCSWSAIKDRVKGLMACILLMEAGTIGVFTSLDLVLFFLF